MVRIFCASSETDALIDAMSKTMTTTAPMEHAAIAMAAITSAFCASVGSGSGTVTSSATTRDHDKYIKVNVRTPHLI